MRRTHQKAVDEQISEPEGHYRLRSYGRQRLRAKRAFKARAYLYG